MTESPFAEISGGLVGLNLGLWGLVKLGVVLGLLIYVGFAVMILRQVGLMNQSLSADLSLRLNYLARFYLTATIIVFFIALIFL
ncbi:MAG: hypothetical protein JW991_03685 [Candidatus Pacebacteria bacterium]|nr:hypothetical protein [Candidatus Paceibacterota bacterium]